MGTPEMGPSEPSQGSRSLGAWVSPLTRIHTAGTGLTRQQLQSTMVRSRGQPESACDLKPLALELTFPRTTHDI